MGSTGSSSPQRADEEDEDVDLPSVMEMEEDIPLAKTGFNPVPAYPPIQVCCIYCAIVCVSYMTCGFCV